MTAARKGELELEVEAEVADAATEDMEGGFSTDVIVDEFAFIKLV